MMKPRAISIKEAYQISPRLTDPLPDGSVREVVILLAYMADMESYFRRYGDQQGRETLQRYQNIITGIVEEHDGVVSKTSGNAVWAYFLDAGSGTACAIEVQKRIETHNAEKDEEERVRLRIGIHFGEVIVEKQELYGHTINWIGKIVEKIAPETICITQPLYERVRESLSHPVTPLPLPEASETPVYNLQWAETAPPPKPGPTAKAESGTVLLARPIWYISRDWFKNAWADLIRARITLPGVPPHRDALRDYTLVFDIPSLQRATEIADALLRYLWARKRRNALVMPVQFLVARNEKGRPQAPGEVWHHIPPGTLRVTRKCAERLSKPESVGVVVAPDEKSGDLSRIDAHLFSVRTPDALFHYAEAMAVGPHPPCFYCGSRRHRLPKCPTKKMGAQPFAIDALARRAPQSLDDLFFRHLMEELSASRKGEKYPDKGRGDVAEAAYAFYELKFIYQLRFFSLLWNNASDGWERIIHPKGTSRRRNTTGRLWLAFNCIQNENYDQAEKMIDAAIRQDATDFHVYCCLGFLSLETDHSMRARDAFRQALFYARTNPQRIFANFVIFRMALLQGNIIDAEKCINEILLLYPKCPQARYQNILFQFENGFESAAMNNLRQLIQDDCSYFAVALIDPELAPHYRTVHDGLKRLHREVALDAEKEVPGVQAELSRLRGLLEPDDPALREIESDWQKARTLYETDSYLGYLEFKRWAERLVSKINRVIRERREKVFQRLSERQDRCIDMVHAMKGFPLEGFTLSLYQQIKSVQNEIDALRKSVNDDMPGIYNTAVERSEEMGKRLDQLDFRLKVLSNFRQTRNFIFTFLKVTFILQSINLMIGLVLLPIILRYAAAPFIDINLAYLNFYIIGALLFGALFSFLFAIWKGIESMGLK